MTKYKEYVERMLQTEEALFQEFKEIHAKYSSDQDKFQEEFNLVGEKVLRVVREWENKLCRQSEKAGFGNYTAGLAEKFQAEVKKFFPLIDHVGIIIEEKPPFNLKRIKLGY
ncbi:MAG: hypothetical protein UX88_C0005G0029 [Candidatus Woesebacteria bacterium GW2011_GWC2_47_16]|uniref:Uncharacterized protein n=8 Tax=Candidatus Woeseibacteriota TaxID=1752722 RepID=A0A0G1QSJ2_9BACT|nr:MAG: hypothetical protein UX34_C0001G0029 [Candidatus Woesebacteria bacterium GW2011_GWF1_46_13]KKU47889.1 MAG: hypothetical protein UX67_C0027G0006 [Candidatus Woesebacteria bacterium GW2011_GWF2_46_8]KKU65219.1 MAG: hypothetical protein UX88_C0005G0029 [Candidatus Woesebacteria bacterium GW2011_GWC2_47_16]KKU71110.1 MAG: hypothetical protein UX95_C0004G0013 [Candidatus Woesebacteria bacterium GW2011_GWD1_47_21]OGM78012.1 MAG: hypothetical protein A2197_00545 [Candidatus Woesebacteria bacte